MQSLPLVLALLTQIPTGQPVEAAASGSATASSQVIPPGQGAPVVIGVDTILWIRTSIGSFAAVERAEAVARRLREISGEAYLRRDSVEIRTMAGETDLLVGGRVLLAVTDADAAAEAIPRDSLARIQARALERALEQTSLGARARAIGVGVLSALLVAATIFLVFRILNRIFPRLYAAVERERGRRLRSLRIQKVEILPEDQLVAAIIGALKILRILLLAALLYLSIPIILSVFPWTRPYGRLLFGFILTPFAAVWRGLLSYLPNIFTLGAIALTTVYLLKLIRVVFLGLARGRITLTGFYPDWAIPTYKLVRGLVLVFALIASWPYLPGSASPAFQGVGVFLGLLVSLGSASAISNVVGGVVLTYMRPFRVGDRVKIADTLGDVVEKTLLITRIRTPKNVEITIPNAMVLSSHIVNYSASLGAGGLILHTTVTIGYDVPWRQVHALLVAAALDVPEVTRDPAPFVHQTSLQDYYPSYELNAYTTAPNQTPAIYTRLHESIQDHFAAAGVEILSPAYTALRDGRPSTVPVGHTASPDVTGSPSSGSGAPADS